MKNLLLIFSVLLSTSIYAQIGPDGTGTVNGYNIGPGANLRYADLTSADLTGAYLRDADLSSADLTGANLSDTLLEYAYLGGADLRGADLQGANLFGADLADANLSGANLTGVYGANITGTPILPSGYQITIGALVGPYVNLYSSVFAFADLSGANLEYANLEGADLQGANLSGANLRGADLTDALIIDADLSSADLSSADLNGADLSGSNLADANLSGADLIGADLSRADLSGTIWLNVVSQSDYDAVVADRDAALAAQASAEAERDARPTQAAYDAVVAERDARPTQAAYDAVVAERDAKLSLDEVKDLRAGSTMIEIHDGQATLTMEVEESDDLGIWTNGGTASVQINVQPGEDKKFFRFKMDDSSSSTDETGGSFPVSYVDLVVNLSSDGSYDFISVSNHPLNDYNGVYFTQPDLINNMPYFKSSNQKYLYFYKGASGGLLSWSFYNALPDGISDLFTGGWIHPYPVLETGNFNIFEVEAE